MASDIDVARSFCAWPSRSPSANRRSSRALTPGSRLMRRRLARWESDWLPRWSRRPARHTWLGACSTKSDARTCAGSQFLAARARSSCMPAHIERPGATRSGLVQGTSAVYDHRDFPGRRGTVQEARQPVLSLCWMIPWRRRNFSWGRRNFSWGRRNFSWARWNFSWARRNFSWARRNFSWARRNLSWGRTTKGSSRQRFARAHRNISWARTTEGVNRRRFAPPGVPGSPPAQPPPAPDRSDFPRRFDLS
jgi:hypothetical protein